MPRRKQENRSEESFDLPCSKSKLLKYINSVVAGKDYSDFSEHEAKEVLSLYISLDDMIRRSKHAKNMLDKLEMDLVEL